MKNTVFFGNGLNRISDNAVSWNDLLNNIKNENQFDHQDLPNTMVYELIFLEKHKPEVSEKSDELQLKQLIADAMKSQGSNEIFELLAEMPFTDYITTNYDYAFEQAIDCSPQKLSTEDIYSLRRKRSYKTACGEKLLWNIHGEIDHPKSIMLGLDHYCGSVSKLDSYVKGMYLHKVSGNTVTVNSMREKLASNEYCQTSWVDLFFSGDVHILGFSLDYSETDIWWLLNKRARFYVDGLVNNKVYFYDSKDIPLEKKELLEYFNVEVVEFDVVEDDYKGMYHSILEHIKKPPQAKVA